MRSIGESCWGEDSDYEAECLTPTLRALEPFQGSRLFIAKYLTNSLVIDFVPWRLCGSVAATPLRALED
jgi:hypothetical protein